MDFPGIHETIYAMVRGEEGAGEDKSFFFVRNRLGRMPMGSGKGPRHFALFGFYSALTAGKMPSCGNYW